MSTRVPAAVSSRKQDCPNQVSLPTTGAPAARAEGSAQRITTNPSSSIQRRKRGRQHMRREYNARVMVTLMSEEGDQPRPSLRESEVAPPRKTLAEILEALPTAPGVYIMKDGRGKPIYIGKAAVLRNRVRQYFQP